MTLPYREACEVSCLFVFGLLVWLLALVGVATIVLAALLARPLKPPPPLASVLDG